MTAAAPTTKTRSRIYRPGKCSGPHQFPQPLSARRPAVVFCVQCQKGHSLA